MEIIGQSQIDVGHALERVITWLREARDPRALSASALSALSRLEASGPLRITDLAEREGLSQPGMTTLANRLEEAGFAVREADPADRRVVRVSITADGAKRIGDHREARATLIASRIFELSIDDQRLLAAAIPALTHFVAVPPQSKEPR